MSLETMSPLYHDSIAPRAASWNKDFGNYTCASVQYTKRTWQVWGFLFFLSCFLKLIVNVSHSLLFSF